jgi:hypothetical protein
MNVILLPVNKGEIWFLSGIKINATKCVKIVSLFSQQW